MSESVAGQLSISGGADKFPDNEMSREEFAQTMQKIFAELPENCVIEAIIRRTEKTMDGVLAIVEIALRDGTNSETWIKSRLVCKFLSYQ